MLVLVLAAQNWISIQNMRRIGALKVLLFFAQTSFWTYSIVQADPYSQDWYSGQIDLNHTKLSSSSVSDDVARGVMKHEIGHAFGLDHNNSNQYSIMCQMEFGRQVQSMQAVDNTALNGLYP